MSKILILDDMNERHNGFKAILSQHQLTHAYNCQQFFSSLKRDTFDVLLLDHDLGEELDGRDAVRWLGQNLDRCPNKILIHSWNAFCADEMEHTLKSFPGTRLIVNHPFVVWAEVPQPGWDENDIRETAMVKNSIRNFANIVNNLINASV